jgi:nicotinate-nucleotide adenylyltransferase
MRVSAIELAAPERPYTVETLSSFRERAGDATRLFFVMGADSWEEITTWREWERVLTLTETIVMTRPGYELPTAHVTDEIRRRIIDVRGRTREEIESEVENSDEARVFLSDVSNVDASATVVRAAVEQGELSKLGTLVAPEVAEYIKKYGLYRGADGTEFSDAGIKEKN